MKRLFQAMTVRRALAWILVFATLTALVWIAAILWWQSMERPVSMAEMVFTLLLVPIGLVAALAIVHGRRSESAAAPNTSSAGDSHPATVKQPPMLYLLSCWAVAPVGATATEFHQALHQRNLRPRPDPALRDENGFPVMAARIAELDADAALARLDELLPIADPGAAASLPEEYFFRLFAMLDNLCDQIAIGWPIDLERQVNSFDTGSPATLRGAMPQPTEQVQAIHWHASILLPESIQPKQSAAIADYLKNRLTAINATWAAHDVTARPGANELDAIATIEEFRQAFADSSSAHGILLIAADTKLCDEIVATWQSEGRLFQADLPHGLMPGEAAFALLYVNQAALQLTKSTAIGRLAAVERVRRLAAAQERGRPCSAALSEAIQKALSNAGIDGNQVGAVVCDADHRSSRTLECLQAMLEHTPQLDGVEQRLAIGESCGHTGVAALAGAMAASAMEIQHSNQPTLLINVGHLFDRAAVVMLPVEPDVAPAG